MNRQLAIVPLQEEAAFNRYVQQFRQEDFNIEPMKLRDKVESALRQMGFANDKSISYQDEVLSVIRSKKAGKIKWSVVIAASKAKFLMTIFITTLSKVENKKEIWNIKKKLRAYPVHEKKHWKESALTLRREQIIKEKAYQNIRSGIIKVESGPVKRLNFTNEDGICKITSTKEISNILNDLDLAING